MEKKKVDLKSDLQLALDKLKGAKMEGDSLNQAVQYKTKKISIAIFIFLSLLINSCTVPKDARVLKRTSKQWRESQIVLYAWVDTPFSGIFLTLRDNGKFEHTSSGLLKSFEAGTWTTSQDTIKLVYLDSKRNTIRNQNVIVDRQTSTLIFEGDSTPVQMRPRIMKNEIK